ncbi:F-box/kelch-repeat protein At3g06240-like [Papaver somniferum]|uniref:F-box/kelch-repeat protein At3g06240-like n=1 Tax=Papaver somniferum TaxID=3469 RepID=UPI000E701BD6|nr:F-box/kelch-repeat protein At3g06240-like [Papaver somniferum]
MHLNHAVVNNNYTVFIGASYNTEPPSCYSIDFDAASASNSSNKAVKIDLPSTVQCKLLTSRTCVGSCDGILCFSRQNILNDSITICLWNPSTQEYKEIVKKYDGFVAAYGFCYDGKIDDYKLKLIYDKNPDFSEIQAYTLGSNSWKKIGNTLSVYYGTYSSHLVKGAMRWLARKVIVTGDQPAVTMVIVPFDIAEETTKIIQIPSCFSELKIKCKFSSNSRVGVLG